ncbi:MAG: YecA family protein [Pseudomonadota bacterium]
MSPPEFKAESARELSAEDAASPQHRQLEALLSAPSLTKALRLDEVQAYLCAALCGPQPMAEAAWMSRALGGSAALASQAGQDSVAALRAFAQNLEQQLAQGQAPTLIFYAEEKHSGGFGSSNALEQKYLRWCNAYLSAVDDSAEDWFVALGDELAEQADPISRQTIDQLDEYLFPLLVLSGLAKAAARESGEPWPQGSEELALMEDSAAELPQAIADIYCLWVKQAQRSASV